MRTWNPVTADIAAVSSFTATSVASASSPSARVNTASVSSRSSGTGVTQGVSLAMKKA